MTGNRKFVIAFLVVFAALLVWVYISKNNIKGNPENSSGQPKEVSVLALKGPTAMGLVKLMNESDSGAVSEYDYNFTVVASADEVVSKLSGGQTDIALVPANLSSVLYNNTNGNFRVIAVNTLGVLYIVENGNTVKSVEDLRGKTIYASGKGATPEYALNYILENNDIDPSKDVSIEWKSEHTECLSLLMSHENAVAMLPQPFVTVAESKSESIQTVLDLNLEWDRIQSDSKTSSALITGVAIARKEFCDNEKEALVKFLDYYKNSVDFVNNNVEQAAELVANYGIVTKDVAVKAIPKCNITFIEGSGMKERVSGYLSVLLRQNPKSIGGKLPEDDFYFVR